MKKAISLIIRSGDKDSFKKSLVAKIKENV